MKLKNTVFLLLSLLLLSGCFPDKLKDQANNQFGDQHFKTAIALIELYKIREGEYPASLDSLKYTGEWDAMAVQSVTYKKLDDGYELDLVNGWIGKPEHLTYPKEFWKGLGIKKSNLKH